MPRHRRHDHADLFGLEAGAHEPGDLGRHLFGDAAAAAGLEQHHAAAGIRRRRRRPVREERLAEVREDRRVVMVGRRQLLDGRRLRQGLDQRPHGGVGGPADLVRQRHGHLAARGQRPQGAHLGAGHVLEAVGEHGAGVPRVEPALEQTGRELAPARAVVRPGRGHRRPVGGDERGQLLRPGRCGRRLWLRHRRRELVGERAHRVLEPREAGRCRERIQRRLGHDRGQEQPALHLADQRPQLPAAPEHLLEQVVEGADPAADEHAPAAHQLALDGLDVGPVGDDQERVVIRLGRRQEPVKQEGDLAAVGRAEDELERHRWILCAAPRPAGGVNGDCPRLPGTVPASRAPLAGV